MKDQKIYAKEYRNMNGINWSPILKQLKLLSKESKEKICNTCLQFSGGECDIMPMTNALYR